MRLVGLNIGPALVGAVLLAAPVWADDRVRDAAPPLELSEAEMAQLFDVFDSNGNGVVTRPELRTAIKSFRVDLSEEDLGKMITTFDADADETLGRDEFSSLMLGFGAEDTSLKAQMEKTFLRFDTNRDGGLDAREVRALMDASGQAITLREAKTIILEADDDGNGRIDTSEFNNSAG
jgi:calcium-binding protein CML